jgi:hypothetical protein
MNCQALVGNPCNSAGLCQHANDQKYSFNSYNPVNFHNIHIQNNSKLKKIPVKIILTNNENNLNNLSEYSDETSNTKNHFISSKRKIDYIFHIMKSRKKEKKYLRKKFNKIVSRVHNTDCLLKKIKA